SHLSRAWRRLSTPNLPVSTPIPEVRHRASELRERLEDLTVKTRSVAGPETEELQRWLLCEAVCVQSVREASRDLGSAAALARLAREIAGRARGPEGARLQG